MAMKTAARNRSAFRCLGRPAAWRKLSRCMVLCPCSERDNSKKEDEKKKPSMGDLKRIQRYLIEAGQDMRDLLTPRQAGDFADWLWMIVSTCVFTLLSAQLYRVYAFIYYPSLFN